MNTEPKVSPTSGMNMAQRIQHVGGRNPPGSSYIEFGSIQAVEALVNQVFRDLSAAHLERTGQSVTNDAAPNMPASVREYLEEGLDSALEGEEPDTAFAKYVANMLGSDWPPPWGPFVTTPPEAATAEAFGPTYSDFRSEFGARPREAAGKAPASVPNEGIQSLISAIESHAQQEVVPPFSRLKAWADQLRRIAALVAQPRSTT